MAARPATLPLYQTTCFFIPLVAPCTPLLVVLARTVKERDWDARFSNENKAWAKSLDDLPDPDTTSYFRYLINKSHPGLVDLFLTQVRRGYAKEQEKKPSVRESLKQNVERTATERKPGKSKEPNR